MRHLPTFKGRVTGWKRNKKGVGYDGMKTRQVALYKGVNNGRGFGLATARSKRDNVLRGSIQKVYLQW